MDMKEMELGLMTEIHTLKARIAELETITDEKVSHYYDWEDWDVSYEDVYELEQKMENDDYQFMRLGRFQVLPSQYMIRIVRDMDEDVEDEFLIFNTKEAALQAALGGDDE